MRIVIAAPTIVSGESVLENAWIVIEDEYIVEVGSGSRPPGLVEELEGWLIPGFVDIHVHGGGGGSFAQVGEVTTAVDFHRAHGTTSCMASLISAPIELLQSQIAALLPFVDDGTISGIHLEGPFISLVRCGAHDPAVLRNPEVGVVDALLKTLGGRRSMFTIAPELPGAIGAIADLVSHGVIVALGHSNATATEASAGIDAGASVITHLFNAMRPMHHREPGIAEVAMMDERVLLELILDGHHLSDTTAKLIMQTAADRWIAITDSVHVSGMPNGRYLLGDLDIELLNGVVRLVEKGSLAGSTLTMDKVFARLISNFRKTPLSAVQATSYLPANAIGRNDIGRIAVGAYADILLWHGDGVKRVMRRGIWQS
jgi:N-acetylglucosamine-6-phosphate deacetylase